MSVVKATFRFLCIYLKVRATEYFLILPRKNKLMLWSEYKTKFIRKVEEAGNNNSLNVVALERNTQKFSLF